MSKKLTNMATWPCGRWMFMFVFVGASVVGMTISPAASGQTTSTDEESESAATTDDTTTDAAVDRGAAAAFQEVFEQWKSILKDLATLQGKYSLAEPTEMAGLQEQWNAKMAEGEAMMPKLRQVAIDAFEADPRANPDVAKLMLEMIADDIKHDDYESAFQLAEPMAEGDDPDPKLLNLAGIAAFASNQFEKAEKYLSAADRGGALNEQSERFLPFVKQNKELWAKEQEIRDAEAKANDLPQVKLETTAGDIVLELFENEAPETVGNFVSLVEKGFYDGLVFHRVLPGFMAQGGCPKGDGSGGPGYNIYCECYNDNYRNHFAGSLSMAKETARNTGGSQFFITFVPTSHLNGKHTVFGRVLTGMEVLPRIVRVDPADPTRKPDRTVIKKATVVRKRDHKYEPHKVK